MSDKTEAAAVIEYVTLTVTASAAAAAYYWQSTGKHPAGRRFIEGGPDADSGTIELLDASDEPLAAYRFSRRGEGFDFEPAPPRKRRSKPDTAPSDEAAPLALDERNDFQYHLQRIHRGKAAWLEVWESLQEIRDRRLYRETHPTFEAFCREECGFSRQHLNRMIAGAETVKALPVELEPMVSNERQARALGKVSPDQREAVLKKAIQATDGKPTAAAIDEAAQMSARLGIKVNRAEDWNGKKVMVIGNGKPQPKPIKQAAQDATGKAITPAPDTSPAQAAQDAWRADEVERMEQAEAGLAVVANLQRDTALIQWARAQGKLVQIDRQTKWGNPFVMPGDGHRAYVCESFATHYLPRKPSLLKRIPELRGKVLACHCYPEQCHGNHLADLANEGAAK